MEVWEFNKTFHDRLNEYHAVFDNFEQNTSIVGYASIWATYLSEILQKHSWTGVWCSSHKECFEFGLNVPATVNVTVDKIDFDEFIAHASLHPDQEYVKELSGNNVEVHLKNLFVAKEQEFVGNVDYEAIANSLDQFRIFYHYLMWPWDEDIEFNFVTFFPKLENRLKLYYDLTDGTFNRIAQKNCIALISRGKKIHEQMRVLLSESPERVDIDDGLKVSMHLYNSLKSIQNRLQRYEDPKIKKYINIITSNQKHCPGCHLILPQECNISYTRELFVQMNKILPHVDCKNISRSLCDTLQKYDNDDKVLISPGTQSVDSQRIDWNVTLQGLNSEQKPIIIDARPYWYFWKTTADNVILRDVIINLQQCQAAIYISEGVTELNSVIIKVDRSSKSVAVVVDYNGSLVASQCRFLNFDVAIICLSGSAVELTDCTFENNKTCLEIMPGAQVCMANCDLSQSKDGCIKYNGGFDKNHLNSLDSLSSVDTISIRSVKVNNESKAVLYV